MNRSAFVYFDDPFAKERRDKVISLCKIAERSLLQLDDTACNSGEYNIAKEAFDTWGYLMRQRFKWETIIKEHDNPTKL